MTTRHRDVPPGEEPLRRLAFLNSITGGLDFAAKQVVGFAVNPITVGFLGPTLYGVWKIIGQLQNYLATADINVAQPLKLLIAQERSVTPPEQLRKSFTAALCITGMFIPIYGLAGAGIVWIAPRVASVGPEHDAVVRTAAAFLVAAFMLGQLASLFESVLRGMNLMYRRMGLRAGITIVGGVATAGALYLGYGLPGVAAVHILVAILSGLGLWWVIREHVNWFGLAWPGIAVIKDMLSMSTWFAGSKILVLADKSSDILLAGIILGPEVAGAYAISKFLMNSVLGMASQMSAAVTPGLGKLYGERRLDRVFLARSQIIALIWFVVTAPGLVICLWNRAFISNWTEDQYFIGQGATFLIVCVGTLSAVHQIDQALIEISLDVRRKMAVTAGSAATTIALAFALAPPLHATGLLLAIVAGKTVATVGYAQAVTSQTGRPGLMRDLLYSRTALPCIGILAAAGLLLAPALPTIHGWLPLVGVMGATGLLGGGLVWAFAIDEEHHAWIMELARDLYRSYFTSM